MNYVTLLNLEFFKKLPSIRYCIWNIFQLYMGEFILLLVVVVVVVVSIVYLPKETIITLKSASLYIFDAYKT